MNIVLILNIYGGSLRSNDKAIRYRLHHKLGLLKLINNINGLIRNPTIILQFNKLIIVLIFYSHINLHIIIVGYLDLLMQMGL